MISVRDIQARADAATKGPWASDGVLVDTKDHTAIGVLRPGYSASGTIEVYGHTPEDATADANFIGHARMDVPNLIALLKEAERERDFFDNERIKIALDHDDMAEWLSAAFEKIEQLNADLAAVEKVSALLFDLLSEAVRTLEAFQGLKR